MRFLFLAALFAAFTAHADLHTYVARADASAKWTVTEKSEFGDCAVIQAKLTSQTWQGIEWTHDLVFIRPKDAIVQDKMFLLNSGGNFKPQGLPYGVMLATLMKAPVVLVLGIPNQPLLDGKREDDLIAETFVRYLETKDASWPLLFPMVKSIVKAMDAAQDITAREWGTRVEKFVVSGASKRGWTSWLTAAEDARVMAIAPMVIDVLNMQVQMKHQEHCFGGPSEQIRPYTARGLVPMPDTPEARQLWQWVDPFTYRAKFTMPKLVVLGNNDRYWAPDALNLYWDDLPGLKWISYTPNAGHNLVTKKADGGKGDPMRAVHATAAFTRHVMTGRPMPELTWKHDDADGQCRLAVTSKPAARAMRVWRAEAATKDLREARWESRALDAKDGAVAAFEPHPKLGVVSFFVDAEYEIDGLPYTLCTQLRLIETK